MIDIARSHNVLARLALFTAAFIWGTSFIVVKDTVSLMPTHLLLAIRFIAAGIILSVIFAKRLKKINFEYIWQGAVIGLFLFLAYSTQTIGITYTTPGKNAFLTAIYCVIVPFMFWGITKRKPDIYNVIAAVLCIIGIWFVSLTQDFGMGLGDVLTLVGGVFFAAHLVSVSIFGSQKDPIIITILQFFYAGIFSLIVTLTTEKMPTAISSEGITSLIYLTVLCTAVTLLLQNVGQKNTNPSAAAIILSLESVFGAMISVMLGYEVLSVRLFTGFTLIFIAVIISETKLDFIKKIRLYLGNNKKN